jgi:hypothetical protein
MSACEGEKSVVSEVEKARLSVHDWGGDKKTR